MDAASGTGERAVHGARVLLGFMSEEEAAAFASMWATSTWEELRPRWEAARQEVERMSSPDPPQPKLEPLPGEAHEHVEAVQASADFQRVFGGRQGVFALVQVDALVSLQRYVDTDYAMEAVAGITGLSSLQAKLACCLPLQDAARCFVAFDDAPTLSATVTSLSRNLDVSTLQVGREPGEPIRISFDVRPAPGWVQVVEHEGRYFLRDGYHRAWGMRALGEELVPAIVWTAESVEDVSGPRVLPPGVIASGRPPLFRHFFDETVAPEVAVKSSMSVIRIRAEKFTVPRLP